jgi:hypothetical protein
MHFPKFWALGTAGKYRCWRSSDVSEADAKAQADTAAATIGARVDAVAHWKYGYPDRAVREEVLQQSLDASGQVAWAITRNAYGCEVLNTARMVFVDVDHPDAALAQNLDKARRWVDKHPGFSLRAYRTRAGLRLLVTHALFAPDDPVVMKDLFPGLGTDLLYARLCKTQSSFRARLTPKPWRCGCQAPHLRWPWRDASAKERFLQWAGAYQAAAKKYATCELAAEIGPRSVHPDLAKPIALHDERSRVGSGLPLA